MVTLEEATVISAPIERCFDLARSSAVVTGGITSGLMEPGQRFTWRAKHFGLWHELTSEITAMDRPASFEETIVRGIFSGMQHDHRFRELSNGRTEMRDVFGFTSAVPGPGRLAESLVLRRYVHALRTERNASIKEIAESNDWPAYLGNWEAMIDLSSCRRRGYC